MAIPKGGLSNDHVLIIPIDHHPATAQLPDKSVDEICRYKSALRKFFAERGRAMIAFERNLPTRGAAHAHIQVFICWLFVAAVCMCVCVC